MILLDFKKIPRPERSGIMAVLLAYAMLSGYFEIIYASSRDGWPSIVCYLFPWDCPPQGEKVETRAELERKFHIILLSKFATHTDKKSCLCHWDMSTDGKVEHFQSQDYAISCDSDIPDGREEWYGHIYKWGLHCPTKDLP